MSCIGKMFNKESIALRILVTFILLLLVQLLSGPQNPFVGDAGEYLDMAARMARGEDGSPGFNLYRFDSALRGYFFSFLLLPITAAAHFANIPYTYLVKLFSCAWGAVLIGALLPIFWQHFVQSTMLLSWPRHLLLTGAFLLFWGSFLSYSLTDIPALTLLLGALLSLRSNKLMYWFTAGLCLAAMSNIRPAYVIAIPVVGVFITLLIWKSPRLQWLRLLALAVGLAVVWSPQLLLNHHNFHKTTPLVIGEYGDQSAQRAGIDNLYLWHLNAALKVQKFGPAIFNGGKVDVQIIGDPAGERISRSRNGRLITSFGEYLASVLANPIEYLALYTRHIFNGFDIDYYSPYAGNKQGVSSLYNFVNYTFIFFGLLSLYRKRKNAATAWGLTALVVLILVAAISIPIVIEPRFFMPVHLLLLAATVAELKPAVWNRWRKQRTAMLNTVLVMYVFWLVVAFTLHNSAQGLIIWKSQHPLISI